MARLGKWGLIVFAAQVFAFMVQFHFSGLILAFLAAVVAPALGFLFLQDQPGAESRSVEHLLRGAIIAAIGGVGISIVWLFLGMSSVVSVGVTVIILAIFGHGVWHFVHEAVEASPDIAPEDRFAALWIATPVVSVVASIVQLTRDLGRSTRRAE